MHRRRRWQADCCCVQKKLNTLSKNYNTASAYTTYFPPACFVTWFCDVGHDWLENYPKWNPSFTGTLTCPAINLLYREWLLYHQHNRSAQLFWFFLFCTTWKAKANQQQDAGRSQKPEWFCSSSQPKVIGSWEAAKAKPRQHGRRPVWRLIIAKRTKPIQDDTQAYINEQNNAR